MNNQDDIEISFSFSGSIKKILPIIKQLKGKGLKSEAKISVKVLGDAHNWTGKRHYERSSLPLIQGGDGSKSFEQLGRFITQRRISDDLAHELEEVIKELQAITAS